MGEDLAKRFPWRAAFGVESFESRMVVVWAWALVSASVRAGYARWGDDSSACAGGTIVRREWSIES